MTVTFTKCFSQNETFRCSLTQADICQHSHKAQLSGCHLKFTFQPEYYSWFRVRLNECPRSIQTLSVQVLVYWGSTTLLPKTSSSQVVMQLGSFLSTSTPTQRWRICYTCSVQDLHLGHEPKIRERKILILSLLDISIKGSHPVFFFFLVHCNMVWCYSVI